MEDKNLVEETNFKKEEFQEEFEKKIKFSGKFGIFPFLFVGLYYVWQGMVIYGIFLVLLCLVLPLKAYFMVGLVVALFFGKVEGMARIGNMLLSVLLAILFIVGKVARFYITGGI